MKRRMKRGDRFLMIRGDGPRAGAVMGVGVVTQASADGGVEFFTEGTDGLKGSGTINDDEAIKYKAMVFPDYVDFVPIDQDEGMKH